MRRLLLTWLAVTAFTCNSDQLRAAQAKLKIGESANDLAIIPQPVQLERGDGSFRFAPTTRISATGKARAEAERLIGFLTPAMGFQLRLTDDVTAAKDLVALALDTSLQDQLGPEGYTLHITPQRIDIRAAAPAGLFYAVQTLRQLLPVQVFSTGHVDGVTWTVPCVTITDYPRFGWRGLLIDPARHFISVADVKHFIDAMAVHKFNRLQMHLTDNEGWRVEIKKYPKLTTIGSQMDWSVRHERGEGPRCFGFYSQDDIRQLIRYAAERHIEIVPEIEMPYHIGAAIVAYPQLGLNAKELAQLSPEQRWRKTTGLLSPRPETVAFLQDVLGEVIQLFPCRYIHIGGDEANIAEWTNSPEVQALIRQLVLKDAHALHSHFIKEMDAFLTKHGRRLIGWDEILQGGLATGATVMSWRGIRGGIAAAQAGHDVVMAPTSHTYFDYRQASDEKGLGRSVISWQKVYSFEPIPKELTADQARHVLGGQGQLWGELIATAQRRDFMTWPRACALSEVSWSSRAARNMDLFLLRLAKHLERLAAARINYRPIDRKPERWQGTKDADAAKAAGQLLARLLPDHVNHFVFQVIGPEAGRDVFEIETRNGKVVIGGNTGVSMATGLNWYLKHYCHCHVSWYGDQLDLPDPLPVIQPKVRHVAWAKHRYMLNYCCFGYSLPFWDWPQWQRLIDWMALSGVNMPLSVTGEEAVWVAVCKRLGLRDQEIADFLAGPPYLPFQWMGCLDSWGGPLPADWVERHVALERQILARQRELGMTPVLQGFTGHVPPAIKQKFPNAKLHTIHWVEWTTHLLDPLDPLFARIAALWMEEQTRLFGTDHYYAADTFIEMKPPSGDLKYLNRLAQAIYNGMATSDRQAVWILQTWIFLNQQSFWSQDRIQAFLNAVPDDHMLCLDLCCEDRPQWSRTEAFCGKPWLWCNIQDWGRTVFLGGALNTMATDLPAARASAKSGRLAGLGFVNEGLGYNPVAYDLLYELAWRDQSVDLNAWIADYAGHRYGVANASATNAWQILLDTVYTAPHRTRSVIDQAPTLSASRGQVPYDNWRLADAWRDLLAASDQLSDRDTYLFDLVNIGRQVLVNHAATLHQNMVNAYRAKDREAFDKAAEAFLQLVQDVDQLLATRREFLLGRWLQDARRWGATDAEKDRLEWNGRRVLTLWGATERLSDYARKEWNGLMGDYYLQRWQMLISATREALNQGKPLDEKIYDGQLARWMTEWSDRNDRYPVTPHGDAIAVTRQLWHKYGGSFQPDSMSLTTGKPAVCSHALPNCSAQLANDGRTSNTNRFWATDVQQQSGPAWWQVDLQTPTAVGRVVVVGYYGDLRYYGFTVETSLDGKAWAQVANRRDNRAPSTSDGYTCIFPPRTVRYLRVTQTHNSANSGRHLVEVMAFEK